jgi:SNF2 family DNA or RNA helicase
MKITPNGDMLELTFPYNYNIKEMVKAMSGSKWIPERKIWAVKDVPRNRFNLDYIMGKPVFDIYRKSLVVLHYDRDLRDNQKIAIPHIITRKQCILGAEMGLGKTLITIEVMERVGGRWAYIAPKSVIKAIKIELDKWQAKVIPTLCTYGSISKLNYSLFDGVIFDECQNIKNKTTKRSENAMKLADAIRAKGGYIVEMSGTPDPKNPVDWWNLAETACPGYLLEGDPNKLARRLGLFEDREGLSGNTYPHRITWFDRDDLCKTCGMPKDQHTTNHAYIAADANSIFCDVCGKTAGDHDADHYFVQAKNEVAALGRRLAGLVMTQMKKDFTDLPEKQYRVIRVKPTSEQLNYAKMINCLGKQAATKLGLHRALSDGFQYITQDTDIDIPCKACNGTGKATLGSVDAPYVGKCPICNGSKVVKKKEKKGYRIATGKDAALRDLLDEYEHLGRFICFAAFHESVDRCAEICREQGWKVIKVDGRGYSSDLNVKDDVAAIKMFQSDSEEKIAYVANAKSGGVGVTLTKSCIEVFYSNSFDNEARPQAEDRAHRYGMDMNRGLTIVDLYCLPTDEFTHNNLKNKTRLSIITNTQIINCYDEKLR